MSVPAEPQWYVVIEELVGMGQGARTGTSSHIPARTYEEADQLARHCARHHRPRHPANVRSRSLYRVGDGSWLVVTKGLSGQSFQFRVSVAQWYGTYPD